MRRFALIVSMLLLVNVAAGSAITRTPAGNAGPTRLIAFLRFIGEHRALYVMDENGSSQRRVAGVDIADFAWSPDGRRLVFLRTPQEAFFAEYDLFVVNADGTGLRRILKHIGQGLMGELIGSPAWSPDGRRIAFSSNRRSNGRVSLSDSYIYVINADGTGLRKLSRKRGLEGYGDHPEWSPDGRKIAFDGYTPDFDEGVFVMNADGSGVRLLARTLAQVTNIAWSPDGRRIVYSHGTFDPRPEGYLSVVNADGSGFRNLVRAPGGNSEHPSWSPDGRRIVFAWFPEGGTGIHLYVINADGSGLRRLTRKAGAESPEWSPAGDEIVFSYDVAISFYESEIFVVRANGTDLRRLTRNDRDEESPAWQPVAAP